MECRRHSRSSEKDAGYNHPMKEIDTYRYGRKEIGRYMECCKDLAGTPAFYG
jgi:hypothetical protein